MKKRKSVLIFSELPIRPVKLDSEKFSMVFGGCGTTGESCLRGIAGDSCCPGHACGTMMFSGFAPGPLQNGTCS